VLFPAGWRAQPSPAARPRPVLAPRSNIHLARLRVTRHQRGFKPFTVRSSPRPRHRDGTSDASAFPRASHPAGQEPTTHVEVGTGHRARTWNHTLNITSADPPIGSSLITCDIASQRQSRDSRRRPEAAGEPARCGHPIVAIGLARYRPSGGRMRSRMLSVRGLLISRRQWHRFAAESAQGRTSASVLSAPAACERGPAQRRRARHSAPL
jgi:hypothetical protein